MRSALLIVLRVVKVFFLCVTAAFATCLLIVAYATFSVLHGYKGSGTLPADCAIVFGAAVYGSQFPGPGIVRRVGGAGEYYREGLIEGKIILTGGTGTGNKFSEAQVMKREALKQGIPSSRIITEEDSHSTLENLTYSQPLAKGCKNVVGISDNYHLARIDLLAGRLDWENFSTVPIRGTPIPDFERKTIAREILAYIYYALHLDTLIHLYTE